MASVRVDEYDVLGYRARAGGCEPAGYTAVRQLLGGFGAMPVSGSELPSYELLLLDGKWHVRLDGFSMHIDTDFATSLGVLEVQLTKDALAPRQEWFHMHGAALADPAGRAAIVLAGESGNGKTTLTLALLKRGFLPFADDVALIDPDTLEVRALRRAFHASDDSLRLAHDVAGGPLTSGGAVPAGYFMPSRWAAEPLPVRWVLFLDLQPGEAPALAPLRPADAASAILVQALNLPQATRVGLATSAALTARANCCRFVHGDLEESVALVERLMRENDQLSERG